MLSFEIISDEISFHALRPEWDRLSASFAWQNPFTSFGWTRACFAEHRAESTLWIIVARDGSRVVGIAPLMTARRDSEDALVFIADTRGDYLGFLAETPLVERELWTEVLQRRGARRVILCNLVAETSTLQQLSGAVHINDAFQYVHDGHARVPSWLRVAARKRRGWCRAGGVIERHTGERAASFVPRIAETEAASWKGAAGIFRFATESQQEFLRTAFRHCPELELWLARYETAIAAYEITFRVRQSVWFYQGAYLPRFAAFTPGNILHQAAVDYGTRGHGGDYDLLSGREPYKTARTNVQRPMYRLIAG